MKTAISIPDELFEAGERIARKLGLSRSALYQRALARFIDEFSHHVVSERLDAVYEAGSEESELDPILERLQTATLDPEEW
ncbi:ChpI protein [Gemmatimonadota bacterium]